jgi:type IV secretion system protein VirB1
MDINLGLTGINFRDLPHLGLSLSEAFDACANLGGAAAQLMEYRAVAVQGDDANPDVAMLRNFLGRGAPNLDTALEASLMAEIERLGPILPSIKLNTSGSSDQDEAVSGNAPETGVELVNPSGQSKAPTQRPSWDVFRSDRNTSVLVFPNH